MGQLDTKEVPCTLHEDLVRLLTLVTSRCTSWQIQEHVAMLSLLGSRPASVKGTLRDRGATGTSVYKA